MASAMRFKVDSNLPKVKQAATSTVMAARELALRAGESKARAGIMQVNASRNYTLPDSVGTERQGTSSGVLFLGKLDEFWWRFFEYGTVFIDAYPILRPAAKAMNVVFEGAIVGELDRRIKRKATAH